MFQIVSHASLSLFLQHVFAVYDMEKAYTYVYYRDTVEG